MTRLSERYRWLIALGASLVLSLMVFQRFLCTGEMPFFGESSGSVDPMTYLIMEGLKAGHIQLWNSHVFGGVPTYMDGFSQPFSPFQWLSFIFAFPDVQVWKAILMLFLAGFGGFGFLYKGLRLSPEAALFGAIGFLLSPMVVQFPDGHILYQSIFLPYALLPSTLWGLTHIVRGESWNERRWGIIGFSFIASLSFLGGHMNTLLWYVLFCGSYALWLFASEKNKSDALLAMVSAAVLTALLSAPALLGWRDSLPQSWRVFMVEHISEFPLARIGIKKEALSGLFYQVHSRHGMGSLHAGLPIVFLGLVAAFAPNRREERYFRFWLFYAVFLILLNLAPLSWNAKLLYPMDMSVNLFRRGLFMSVTSLIVLASVRFDTYFRARRMDLPEIYGPICKIVALMVLGAASYFIWRGAHISIVKRMTPAGWTLAWVIVAACYVISRRSPPTWLKSIGFLWLLPVSILALEQLYFINHRERPEVRQYSLYYHPVQHNRHIFDSDPLITKIQNTGPFFRTAVFQPNLPTDDLYENLFLIRWSANLSVMNHWHNYTGWMSDFPANYYAYFRKHFPGSDRYGMVAWEKPTSMLSEAGRAVSAGWVLTTERLTKPFIEVAVQPPLHLYRNPLAYPRAFMLSRSEAEAWDGVQVKNYAMTQVKSFVDHGDQVNISVSSNRPASLIVTDTYYPGWKVYVNGKEQVIRPIRDTFRAVDIDRGSHDVHFVFKPAFVQQAFALSFFGLFCLCLLPFVPLPERRNVS